MDVEGLPTVGGTIRQQLGLSCMSNVANSACEVSLEAAFHMAPTSVSS